MEIFFLILIFVFGLCMGSFINMMVYRVAVKYGLEKENKKIRNKTRSYCDFCGRQLKWYENIPVLSWLFQKGKSRCCRKKLPALYPIVEVLTGVLLVFFNYKYGIISNLLYSFELIGLMRLGISLILITLLVFSAAFDLKYMILPDFSTVILIIMAFLGVVFDEPNVVPYLLSGLGAMAFLYLLYLITKKKGMGFGDVKLALFMGLFLGWPKIIVAFYSAFVLGALYGIMGMMLKKVNKKSKVPFGPFLIIGFFLAWWWGEKIIYLILNI
jgi:prepilin signal peptidase PulO-like enzyme (type II secretory pathway)